MKILVTGGAGFIGSHVTKKLIKQGRDVVLLDNFNPYYSPRLKEARISIFLKNLPAKIEHIDITNIESLRALFAKEKFDRVCHLAAQAGVRYSLEHPEVYVESNVKGFLNILECIRHFGKPPLVYASTSSVYGANTKLPFSEEDRVNKPISLYAATKRANELMAFNYHHLFGIKATGLRFFTVYGPWGRPDMALFLFASAIEKDEPIKLFNGGNMKRDFTYVTDIADGVVAALENPFEYEIINLARGEQQQLTDYVAALERHIGKVAKKEMLPMQAGDVPATSADISKAKRLLWYNPKVSIDEGIKNFVDWYEEYKEKLKLNDL